MTAGRSQELIDAELARGGTRPTTGLFYLLSAIADEAGPRVAFNLIPKIARGVMIAINGGEEVNKTLAATIAAMGKDIKDVK